MSFSFGKSLRVLLPLRQAQFACIKLALTDALALALSLLVSEFVSVSVSLLRSPSILHLNGLKMSSNQPSGEQRQGAASRSRGQRTFDLMIFGATGFTGHLVCEYVAARANHFNPPLKWAVAGHIPSQVANVAAEFALPSTAAVVADVNDFSSLTNMTASARVILTTVGPYTRYGEPTVAAAVQTDSDYVDITAETPWVRDMIDKYESHVKNALIINCCGVDSVPSDIGTYYAAKLLREEHHQFAAHCQSYWYLTAPFYRFSGGTIASLGGLIGTPAENRVWDRHLLTPEPIRSERTRMDLPEERDQYFIRYSSDAGGFTAPYVMQPFNTRVVRRSHALFENSGQSLGRWMTYNECVGTARDMIISLVASIMVTLYCIGSYFIFKIAIVRSLYMWWFAPRPGQGPSKESREKSHFEMLTYAHGEQGALSTVVVSGKDPAYGGTARMAAECAFILARQRESLSAKPGFTTPAFALNDHLIDGLRTAGFTVSKVKA